MVRPLRLFVSYASEDSQLAIALHQSLKTHLEPVFAEVSIDTESLRAGFDLTEQIREQLARTDILIVVYTGQLKHSHGFTGIEIGFFLGQKGPSDVEGLSRRIVPFYREVPPDVALATKGIRFGIDKATLRLGLKKYESYAKGRDGG